VCGQFGMWVPRSSCDRKARAASAQSLHTVAASNNRDHMPWTLYYCLFAPHVVLFFAHIPFVVNRTFNATLTERLQHLCCWEQFKCKQATQPWVPGDTISPSLQCWFSFRIDRTRQKTDQVHAEDPVEKTLPQLCPSQMACWAKKYVNILTRAEHWMAYFDFSNLDLVLTNILKVLFCLLLVFRSICHQVSKQADFIISRRFTQLLKWVLF